MFLPGAHTGSRQRTTQEAEGRTGLAPVTTSQSLYVSRVVAGRLEKGESEEWLGLFRAQEGS